MIKIKLLGSIARPTFSIRQCPTDGPMRLRQPLRGQNRGQNRGRNLGQDLGQDRGRNRGPGQLRGPGFSLVELMVVLVIIGLLAGAVTLSVSVFVTSGKQNTARMEISTICEALENYRLINGRLPNNDEGLAVLSEKTENSEAILQQKPIDPWGNPYQYNVPGRQTEYEVICFGADGREGGEGENADIVSWDLKN